MSGKHGETEDDGLTPERRAKVDAAVERIAARIGTELARQDVEIARGKALLLQMEWAGRRDSLPCCPICLAFAFNNHELSCRLADYIHPPVPR